MNDSTPDPLMEALGRQARKDLEARDVESADDPWAAALAEPLGEEFKASMVQRLQEESNAPKNDPVVAGPADPPRRPLASRRHWATLPKSSPTAALALAASLLMAVALVVLLPTDSPRPALPAFTLDLQGIDGERSSDPLTGDDAGIVRQGETLRFRLRPETPVEGDLQIVVRVRDSTNSVHPWPEAEAKAEVQGDGTILVNDLPWQHGAGEWVLMIHVLRPGEEALPPDSPGESGRWIEKDLRVVP